MSKFQVIWKETYKRNIKSGAFITMMLLPIFLIGVFQFVNHMIGSEAQNAKTSQIAVVTSETHLIETLKSNAPTYTFEALSEQEAISQLSDDKIDGYLVVKRQSDNTLTATFNKKTTSKDTDINPLKQVLTGVQVQETAQLLGVSLQDVAALNKVSVSVDTNKLNAESLKQGQAISDSNQSSKDALRQGIAYVSVTVLYIFLVTYGSMVGQEVATEKGTRVMEVVLSSTDAKTHFNGKVTGVSLAILTQLAFYLILGGGYLLFNGNNLPPIQELFDLAGYMILYTIIFVLIGGFLYIVLSAMFGSIASKVEDVQKVLMPVVIFDVLGFYIGMLALPMPNSIIVKIASWFPLLTPMVMPFRIATDTVSSLEIWGSILLTIIFAIFVYRLSILFYKSNVLIYSEKGPWQVFKQSLQLMKTERKAKI